MADRAMMVEGGHHAAAYVAAILQGRAIAVDLEPAAIMALEQLGHEKAHGVAAEIG